MKDMADEQKKMRKQMEKMVTATESLATAILELARARPGQPPAACCPPRAPSRPPDVAVAVRGSAMVLRSFTYTNCPAV